MTAADTHLLLIGTRYDLEAAGEAIINRTAHYYIQKGRDVALREQLVADSPEDEAAFARAAAAARPTEQPESTRSSEPEVLLTSSTPKVGTFSVLRCSFPGLPSMSQAAKPGSKLEPTDYLIRRSFTRSTQPVTVLASITLSGGKRQYDSWVHVPVTSGEQLSTAQQADECDVHADCKVNLHSLSFRMTGVLDIPGD